MKKDNLKISYSELMKTLDNFRSGKKLIGRELTKEQINFLIKSREGFSKVPFHIMANLWQKAGWGKMSYTSMVRTYNHHIKSKAK